MATGTAQTAKVGKTYRVGGDDWWSLPGDDGVVMIKETDQIVVTGKDDVYVYIRVIRDDAVLGVQKINLCFFDEDFELVE